MQQDVVEEAVVEQNVTLCCAGEGNNTFPNAFLLKVPAERKTSTANSKLGQNLPNEPGFYLQVAFSHLHGQVV